MVRHGTSAGLIIVVCVAASMGYAQAPDWATAMDFESPGAWRTAPDLLDEFEEGDLWSTRTIPFAKLAGGVELSREHVKRGEYAGKWADHPRFPTIHTPHVPLDWTGFEALTFWAYSHTPTQEQITVAVASDAVATGWRDYFLFTFCVDWSGWRQLSIPLDRFEAYGQPAGWDRVEGLYLFTKIFDHQPNPYTVLWLDDMRLGPSSGTPTRGIRPPSRRPGTLPCQTQIPPFDARILNHSYPETRGNKPVPAPLQYESYFRAERAVYGYYPRFQPGFVSFSPSGKAYMHCADHIIESLDSEGNWTCRDLLTEVVEPFARETLGFDELGIGNTGQVNDPSIRFDSDGDAYALSYIWDPTRDWRSRKCLLLHSRDDMGTWDVYELPYYMVRFEKFVGHNHDRLARPPVLLMSTYFSPTTNFITVPEKRGDGTLEIPKPIKVAEGAIAFIPHSGEANNAVTCGGKVFITYGKMTVPAGHTKEDGVPAYAVSYDPDTSELSEPVLIGFGGKNAEDDHNWPSIAVDSQGIFHVLINGHHNPMVYTHSLQPYSIETWSKPETVGEGTSYGGLVCDRADTLYSVTRNSAPGYYFRLSLHRKKLRQAWETPRHLVLPFKPYYKVWFHKLVLDPASDRLFLAYHSQSASICVFRDEYLAYLYTWPHREKLFLTGPKEPQMPRGTYHVEPRKYAFFSAPPSEMTVMLSDDGGEQWRLATTPDFR